MTPVSHAVDEWIESGTFESVANGIRPSEEFRATVSERRAAIDNGRDSAFDDLPATLTKAEVGSELLATYTALQESNPDVSSTQAAVVSVLLNSAGDESPPASGTPEGFLPVHGQDLVRLVRLCDRCVVYVWRDNCTPCDTVRSNLSDVFGEDPPDGVLALSVYGPDCAAQLQVAYDVVGGPTTLFTLRGSVDARLVGVADNETIEREIQTLQDRSPPS